MSKVYSVTLRREVVMSLEAASEADAKEQALAMEEEHNWCAPVGGSTLTVETETDVAAAMRDYGVVRDHYDRARAERDALAIAASRLLVGLSGTGTTDCEWYEGIKADAVAELRAALAGVQS